MNAWGASRNRLRAWMFSRRSGAKWPLEKLRILLEKWIEKRVSGKQKAADDAVALAFKPDAMAVEEAPVPLPAHVALHLVLGLLFVSIIWAFVGRVDQIVVAPGKIATRTPLIVIQPFTTSRVTSIKVEPGDHVRKNEILAVFDPTFAKADVDALKRKMLDLEQQIARIEAELDGDPFIAGIGASEERRAQLQIYDQETAAYSAEMAIRDRKGGEIDSQRRADEDSAGALKQQLAMAQKEVGIYQYLLDQAAAAPLDLMKAKSNALDIEERLKNTIGDAKKLEQQRAEIEAERQSYLDKWRSDHVQDLVKARQDLADTLQTLKKATAMKDFTVVRSPVDGTVLEIADRSVGSVLREAETLLTIVPDSAKLYVDANVQSRDISYLRVGDTVHVKLETYRFERYGTLEGRLVEISPDSVPLKDGEQTHLVYRLQVRLTDTPRSLIARGFHLRPGLIASAEIKTGRRSIASYILAPILRTADEGMREP